jgi:chemotaxis protein MotA
MFQIIGIVVLFAMVFGSFIMGGGKMAVILNALPHELMAIGGAGVAAFLISNSMTVIKGVGGGLGKAFAGPKWKAGDYRDLLSLLFMLTKTMKSKGVIALESHIEKPGESTIFSRYPRLTKDHFAIDFICDTLRIVAAVLGVIKTMGSITEPPEVLGAMIGGALVGTFLGVFMAYGMVGPLATRMKAIVDEESAFYRIIQSVLVAHLHGNPAQISVEIGRGDIPTPAQPSFLEMEEALSAAPTDAA